MSTRAVLGSIFASTAVLVVGWQAGGAVLAQETPTTSQQTAISATRTTPTTTTPTGPADGTYTGSSVHTRFGSVQIAVTISQGSIVDITALHLTDADGKSVQISTRAGTILRQEVLTSQSANVSTVAGATYTTKAYLSSVQSALDQASF